MRFEPKYTNVLTKEILEDLYTKQALSIYEIAARFHCTTWTVKSYLKKHNVAIREFIKKDDADKILTKEFLVEHYVEKKLPLKDIEKISGYSIQTIRYYRSKHGIKNRYNKFSSVEEREKHYKDYSKKYYSSEKSREYRRKYHILNKEILNEKYKQRRKSNPTKVLFNNVRRRAKRDNIEFNLKMEDIKIPEYCPYLNIKLDFNASDRNYFPSIDRINNNIGYLPNNIQVLSYKANRCKNNLSMDELKTFAKNINMLYP